MKYLRQSQEWSWFSRTYPDSGTLDVHDIERGLQRLTDKEWAQVVVHDEDEDGFVSSGDAEFDAWRRKQRN